MKIEALRRLLVVADKFRNARGYRYREQHARELLEAFCALEQLAADLEVERAIRRARDLAAFTTSIETGSGARRHLDAALAELELEAADAVCEHLFPLTRLEADARPSGEAA